MKKLRDVAGLAILFTALGCGRGKADAPAPAAPDASGLPAADCADPLRLSHVDSGIPAYKNQFVKNAHWGAFYNAMTADAAPYSTGELFVYTQVFAAEGGMRDTYTYKKDKSGQILRDKDGSPVKINHSTKGGILNGTLAEMRGFHRAPETQALLARYDTTDDLSAADMPRLYRLYFDYALRGAGGHAVLADENRLNTPAAAALADTVFRFGPKGGAKILRDAIERVRPDSIPVTQPDLVGPVIFKAYAALAQDINTLPALLQAVAQERIKAAPDEADRARHFAFAPQVADMQAKQDYCQTRVNTAAQTQKPPPFRG